MSTMTTTSTKKPADPIARDAKLAEAIGQFRMAVQLEGPQMGLRSDLADYAEAWARLVVRDLAVPREEVGNRYPWDLSDVLLPAAVVRALEWLPTEVEVSSRIRRLYRPHVMPHPFLRTLEACDAGERSATPALRCWQAGMVALGEAVELAGSDVSAAEWASGALVCDPLQPQGRRAQRDVDLEAIVGVRTRARAAATRACWGLDGEARAAVLAYVRDVLAEAPALDSHVETLAEEAAQLVVSAMAQGLPAGMGYRSVGAHRPRRDGSFPTVLRTTLQWRSLRDWHRGASPLVAEVLKADDLASAAALLRHRGGPVAVGLRAAGEDPAAIAEYESKMRRLARTTMRRPEVARARLGLPEARRVAAAEARRRERAVEEVLTKIDALVGLDEVKAYARRIVAKARLDQRRAGAGLAPVATSWHLVLTGDPGTGKTTVARLLGELYAALGVLPKGHLVEAAPADLIAPYVGQTEAKTRALVERAMGGVLFLDEAYALCADEGRSYGPDAVAVLIAEMENRREDLVVIAAGYSEEMDHFLATNRGLRGRFGGTLHLPAFTNDQLRGVFDGLAHTHGLRLDEPGGKQLDEVIAAMPRGRDFANARAMRALFEEVVARHAVRLAAEPAAQLEAIDASDLPPSGRPGPDGGARAAADLEAMVGLDGVKEHLRTIALMARARRLHRAAGMPVGAPRVGHMAFVGNPGTGKTTVARLLGQVLAAEGALPSGHLVTATREDLVGQYIGQTAPRTRKVFERAIGGVLFIDEAYSLVPGDGHGHDFGREALATLLPLMEEHADTTVVVFAGYPDDMARMIAANPGLRSRISHTVDFGDYTAAELALVALQAAEHDGFELSAGALERLVGVMEHLPRGPRFGNARDALGVLAEVRGRQARRLAELPAEEAVRLARGLVADDVPEARAT